MPRLALALAAALGLTCFLAGPAAASFNVDSVADDPDAVLNGVCDTPGAGVQCTLRAAVQEANATGALDVITLPAFPIDYRLTTAGAGEDAAATGDLDLNEPVTIQGVGQPVIDGLGADRIFDIGTSGSPGVSIVGVEIRNGGNVDAGGGIRVAAGALGLADSTVAGSSASSGGGDAEGGGVWIGSPTANSISASTVSGNTADGQTGARGGGVEIDSTGTTLNVVNSTISGNQALTGGGAARGGGVASRGAINLTHTTMDLNAAQTAGGSIAALAGSVALRATIVGSGISFPGSENCSSSGGAYVTLGFNLETPTSSFGSQCGLGTGAQDLVGVDAALAPLADRGGPTQTQAPFSSSPALDAIPSCFPVGTDQRGEPRPSGVACEIGSYERQVKAAPGIGCFGRPPTIIGTVASETIVGTPGPDVILGQGGNDLIKGGDAKDLICAGKGKDRVYGGASGDRLAGEDGGDRIFGQAGQDNLLGNAGRDLLNGGADRDSLNGGGNRDRCRGGGHDKLRNCDGKRRPRSSALRRARGPEGGTPRPAR